LHFAANNAVQISLFAITADRDTSAEERYVKQKSEDHCETCHLMNVVFNINTCV